MESLVQDVRYGARMLLKAPGFTAVAVITLALGIGANTAFFSVTNALLLRSLPVREPERLAGVGFAKPGVQFGISVPIFEELRRRQSVFSGLLAWHTSLVTLTETGESRALACAYASGDAFRTLGVNPYLGRLLGPEDDLPSGGPHGWAAVLSYGFWNSRFQRDPAVLGRTLTLSGTAVTIVGVMPPGFTGVEMGVNPDVVVPLAFLPVVEGALARVPTVMGLSVIGRLKPAFTLSQAQEEVQRLGAQIVDEVDTKRVLRKGFFGGGQITAFAGRGGRSFIAGEYREALLALDALAALLLLICSANLAGLVSARAVTRRHEFAVRAALGSRPWRLARQLFMEAMLLCGAGAATGWLAARWMTAALVSLLLSRTTINKGPGLYFDSGPDTHVLLFTILVTCVTGVLVSLPAGLRASRVDVNADLKAGSQVVPARRPLEAWLVAGQVAFAALLVMAAALLAGTMYRLLHVDPGFRTDDVLLVPTDLTHWPEIGARGAELYNRILERLPGMPGVELASAESIPLLSHWSSSTYYASVLPDGSIRKDENLTYNEVGPYYFAASGTRVLAGRDFLPSDRDPKNQVCILSRSAAEYFFPGRSAVGAYVRSIWNARLQDPCQIVGVVEDTKYRDLRTPSPHMIYWTYMTSYITPPKGSLYLVLRTSNPAAAAASARRVLRDLAPGTPLLAPLGRDEVLRASIGRERALAMLAGAFAGLALLMTALGLFGLLSYQVAQRRREIGLRMALGADRRRVLVLVLRRGILLGIFGLVAGMVAAAAVTPLLRNLLFGVGPADPRAFAATAVLLLSIALLASYIPARRATRIDPMVALRYE